MFCCFRRSLIFVYMTFVTCCTPCSEAAVFFFHKHSNTNYQSRVMLGLRRFSRVRVDFGAGIRRSDRAEGRPSRRAARCWGNHSTTVCTFPVPRERKHSESARGASISPDVGVSYLVTLCPPLRQMYPSLLLGVNSVMENGRCTLR